MKSFARILTVALAAVALHAHAQSYPARPVRAIIAFPAGSATDIVGRIITAKVSEIWGQAVVADNRGGAGGSIASAIVAKAAPDGYTLLINSNAHVVNPSMWTKLPYDTLKDFVDIMPLVGQPNVMVVNPGSRLKTFKDFLAEARANPGKINFAFAGLGSGTHLNSEKLKLDAKIDELAKARADFQKKCLAHRIEIRSLLTDEQKKAFDQRCSGMGCGPGLDHGRCCGGCCGDHGCGGHEMGKRGCCGHGFCSFRLHTSASPNFLLSFL